METSGSDVPTDLLLEEYKIVVDQGRFVMTRYMQAIAIYLALVGFALKETLSTSNLLIAILYASLISVLNGAAFYAAYHFRRMAYHALDRQEVLAESLGFSAPYPMIWGYYGGVFLVSVAQLAIIAILTLKLRP